MFHFNRLFRRGSLASLAMLTLALAALGGTVTPAAHADEAVADEVVVVDETGDDEVPGDVGTYAWKTATASSYGPGLWGNTTACGQTLTTSTVGVAHKTMACGTRLKFKGKNGVIVTARVIDRGPYVSGRTFDLTQKLVQNMGYASATDFGVRSVSWDYN